MNKIVPFNKDLFFKTNISEITSISLEKEVSIKDNVVSGDFLLEGDYKISEDDALREPFSFRIPYEIRLGSKYDLSDLDVVINDFYYEVKENKVLSIYIELKLLNLEEIEEVKEEVVLEENRCIEEEHTILNEEETKFVTYKIYIVKDGDTIESIMNRYSVTKESLESYNNISELKLGDKIIIPTDVTNS